MTCTGCLHQDYCIHFGCPFKREPQSSLTRDRREAQPHHACGAHPVDRPGLSVLGKREGQRRKTEQAAGTTLAVHEPRSQSFRSNASTSRPEAAVNPAAYLKPFGHTPATAMALAQASSKSEDAGRVQDRMSVSTRPPFALSSCTGSFPLGQPPARVSERSPAGPVRVSFIPLKVIGGGTDSVREPAQATVSPGPILGEGRRVIALRAPPAPETFP